jgi:hypothetical protein
MLVTGINLYPIVDPEYCSSIIFINDLVEQLISSRGSSTQKGMAMCMLCLYLWLFYIDRCHKPNLKWDRELMRVLKMDLPSSYRLVDQQSLEIRFAFHAGR